MRGAAERGMTRVRCLVAAHRLCAADCRAKAGCTQVHVRRTAHSSLLRTRDAVCFSLYRCWRLPRLILSPCGPHCSATMD